MKIYIDSPTFVGYMDAPLFTGELEHLVENFDSNFNLTRELIKLCADAEVNAPMFETTNQEEDYKVFLTINCISLYDEKDRLLAHKSLSPKPLRVVTFFYKDKKGKTGRRMVEVLEEDDLYLKGIDSDKKEYRQFLKSRISRLAVVTD